MYTSTHSQHLLARVARKGFHKKIMSPAEATQFFRHGQSVGWSGFSPAGYPKAVPLALADHVEINKLQGRMQFDLFAGASVGSEVEDRWASLRMTRSRWPYMAGNAIRQGVNDGSINFKDIHLSHFAQLLAFGFFRTREDTILPGDDSDAATGPALEGTASQLVQDAVKKHGKPLDIGGAGLRKNAINAGRLDIGVLEVTEILADGSLVFGAGIGVAPEVADKADKLILEVNTSLPSYFGMHDIIPDLIPPFRKPFLVNAVEDRIGRPSLRIDPEKVVAVVESRLPDRGNAFSPPDEDSQKIAGHLMSFLEHEVARGRLPRNLLPLQSGVGNIANAVIASLGKGPWQDVSIWTEVLQDTMLDYIDTGKVSFASSAALSLSPAGFERLYSNWPHYASKVILRPQQVTNHPEIIRRLGVIAMNTPVEVDIYAHANSTLVNGTKMVHGIGGSGDFIRNGYLSVMHTPSTRPTKTDPTGISCIVPKCSHIDHTEHDVQVVVTEQGLADLRGLSPRQCAIEIIKNCAHPDYRDILMDYFKKAEAECIKKGAGHEPQLLSRVFKMYESLEKTGSMKVQSW